MRIPFSGGYIPEHTIEAVMTVLHRGGSIAYPTDTVYGLGCDSFNSIAIQKIIRLKQRRKNKPFSIMCSDLRHISDYAIVPTYAFRLMKRALPGPYTFILKATRHAPYEVLSRQKTIGIRVPDHPFCLALVRALGHPIVTTSLNSTGETPITDPADLPTEFARGIDLIIDAGPLWGEPSTVIDVSGDAPVVIRVGSGSLEAIGMSKS